MGGGGGSRRYFASDRLELEKVVEQSQNDLKHQALESGINDYLQSLLAVLNERDAQATQDQLDKIIEALGDAVEIDRLMFGGSVAKHTYVDGLSDVDALVILDSDRYSGKSATQILSTFHRLLKNELSTAVYSKIEKGQMAVTVTLRDGTELQLVPALKSGKIVSVPDRKTGGWIATDPKTFQKQLTAQNVRLNGTLVPAIKLVKSVISGLPDQKQIGGYHVEALAIDAAKSHVGPMTVKSVVTQFFKHAAERVLSPISDVTGQSSHIDSGLGSTNSNKRRIVADAFAALGRKLEAASTVDQWKAAFE